jgi:hypothetical protein
MGGRYSAGATLWRLPGLAMGDVVGRDAAEPGQQLVGTDKLSAALT